MSERPQNRKRDHPLPSFLETRRVDGVKAPPHDGTPRSRRACYRPTRLRTTWRWGPSWTWPPVPHTESCRGSRCRLLYVCLLTTGVGRSWRRGGLPSILSFFVCLTRCAPCWLLLGGSGAQRCSCSCQLYYDRRVALYWRWRAHDLDLLARGKTLANTASPAFLPRCSAVAAQRRRIDHGNGSHTPSLRSVAAPCPTVPLHTANQA